ncbi:hypothetical protein [Streptomyces goshikiensis]|uniref:hypothetical protein n=1 Tax=Streptomyces goshikiensis TaxID=1942 RepID=UPI0022F39AE7|nr:hypothetical protein [Streptomyces goshikiensis]WBY20029.1 hypothetical protein PET44_10545 [Streptomyces goshikiensis]
MTALLLEGLDAPLRALRLLAADHPHLPAPTVSVSTIYPDRLELSFHDGFNAFEAWRDALMIDLNRVDHHVHADGRTQVLAAEVQYAGACLCLVGYTEVLLSAGGRSRVEVAP